MKKLKKGKNSHQIGLNINTFSFENLILTPVYIYKKNM